MRLRTRFWPAVAAATVLAGALAGAPAWADPLPTLALEVTIDADGTAPWDGDDTAGHDSSPANGTVRVNDQVTYALQYSVNDNPATGTTLTVAFPRGMTLDAVPGYCTGPGSSLVPASAGTPALPLTATSLDELSPQTLTCDLGAKTSVSEVAKVTVTVSNLVPHGQVLPLLSASISADGTAASPAPVLPSVTASSALKWDLSKNNTATTANTGWINQNIFACSWNAAVYCFTVTHTLLLGAPSGGRGAMPAIGPITVVDDVSPAALFPGLSPPQAAAAAADPTTYGARITSCPSTGTPNMPGTKIGVAGGTATSSVIDSGACAISQVGGPGTPVTLTITGADTTLRTYPTQSLVSGAALPSTTAYAVAFDLRLEVPVALVQDFGTPTGTLQWGLTSTNTFTGLSIDGLAGTDHQSITDQPTWNDYRSALLQIGFDTMFDKGFVGVPGTVGNSAPGSYRVGYGIAEGPPGGATWRSGNVTAAPGQNIVSTVMLSGPTLTLPDPVAVVGCDSWDSSRLYLRAATVPGSATGGAQRVASGGQAVWVSGYDNAPSTPATTQWATTSAQVPTLQVQYSPAAGGAGAASECGDAQGPWYGSPGAVPGNDPVLAAQGVYTAVGRVRVHMVLPAPAAPAMVSSHSAVRAWVSVSMQVADTAPAGTVVGNWASSKRVPFSSTATMTDVIDDAGAWVLSSFVPATNGGSNGDRLTVVEAQVRLTERVRKGTSDPFGTATPVVTGGDTVQYQLSPSLTSGGPSGTYQTVWVETCLPATQQYTTATLAPSVIDVGSTPGDAKTACPAGATYLRWVLTDQEIGQVIAPIVLTAEVSPAAPDGLSAAPSVVWAAGDTSSLALRSTSAAVLVSNVAGVHLVAWALTPQTQPNAPGQATDETNQWRVELSSTLGYSVSDPDVIDLLPTQGVDGTSFHGTFIFVSTAVVSGGASVQVLYTARSGADADPGAASNGPLGSTTWCDAPVGGAVVSGTGTCPTSAAQVTALRITRPGPFSSGDVVAVQVTMVGVSNAAGDAYTNLAMARAGGLGLPVGPITRAELVVASSVGDYVWWDLDEDGLQSSGEPGADDVQVHLSGTDDLGNTVTATTRTDTDGLYVFDALRASDPAGYTVTVDLPAAAAFTAPGAGPTAGSAGPATVVLGVPIVGVLASASGFTALGVGSDPTVDSDVDPVTGEAVVVLGVGTVLDDIDAGLLADPDGPGPGGPGGPGPGGGPGGGPGPGGPGGGPGPGGLGTDPGTDPGAAPEGAGGTSARAGTTPRSALARTGALVAGTLAVAALALGLGTALVVARRRHP